MLQSPHCRVLGPEMHMLKKEAILSSCFSAAKGRGEWRDQRIPPSYPVVDLGLQCWRTCSSNANYAKVHKDEVGSVLAPIPHTQTPSSKCANTF